MFLFLLLNVLLLIQLLFLQLLLLPDADLLLREGKELGVGR